MGNKIVLAMCLCFWLSHTNGYCNPRDMNGEVFKQNPFSGIKTLVEEKQAPMPKIDVTKLDYSKDFYIKLSEKVLNGNGEEFGYFYSSKDQIIEQNGQKIKFKKNMVYHYGYFYQVSNKKDMKDKKKHKNPRIHFTESGSSEEIFELIRNESLKDDNPSNDIILDGNENKIPGNSTVEQDFTVNGKTNLKDTTVEGTLEAQKDATVNGNSTVKGNSTVEQDFTVNGKTNLKDTTVEGTLEAQKDATVNGNSTVKGNSTVEHDFTVSGKTSLQDTTVEGTLEAQKDATINGNNTVKGNSTVEQDFTVNGKTNLKDTTVEGTLEVQKDATINGNSTVKGSSTIEQDLTVNGKLNLKDVNVRGKLDVQNGATINGNHTVKGSAIVEQDLAVNGRSNLKNTIVEGTLEVYKDTTIHGNILAQDAYLGGRSVLREFGHINNRIDKLLSGTLI